MLGENHLLTHEFPEYLSAIIELKSTNKTFCMLAKRYHELDHQIRGLEKTQIPSSDAYFNQLKAERVNLKDQIYRLLVAHSNQSH
ncbi:MULTISPECIES: YdcH family protein [Shewanella]|uniref:YdcH family protein n=1 Tax=Shewanella fidelis TaxID=173509 RepID=A0AAW8NS24_9GAMM|nr:MULTISPECIES: YdcH family protein [Shewanella]MDR8524523.1 YdcH family protein [Shewanella fidelis]MDW4811999.1 YdcH family protein [Shewanella fidelis]MDW4817062.1 YdcH family protein [Shewanella fidelis]MDW4821132.1 YdcH family protein [Shewanella fidelis]MDW4822605.1 YdcH family protein [Shewanella fidelis]